MPDPHPSTITAHDLVTWLRRFEAMARDNASLCPACNATLNDHFEHGGHTPTCLLGEWLDAIYRTRDFQDRNTGTEAFDRDEPERLVTLKNKLDRIKANATPRLFG